MGNADEQVDSENAKTERRRIKSLNRERLSK